MELTENVDKSIRHEVPKLVGGVTLVDGAGARLHVAENHSVAVYLLPLVFGHVYGKTTTAGTAFRKESCVRGAKGSYIPLTYFLWRRH